MKNILLILTFLISINSYSEEFETATAEWEPYAMKSKDGPVGIAVDILKEVIKRTGHQCTIKLYPATRLNFLLDNNEIDINFADSIIWNDQDKLEKYAFTKPFTIVNEYIYFIPTKYIKVNIPEDLAEKRVGITRGYYYKTFEKVFNKKIVIKDESHNNELLLLKLRKGRNDAILMDSVLFDYLIKKLKLRKSLFKQGLQISTAPLSFKIRITKKKYIPKFNKVISDMKKEGLIKNIINKYTLLNQ